MTVPKSELALGRRFRLLLIPMLGLLLTGCSAFMGGGKQSTIDPVSSVGHSILRVYEIVTWIDVGIFIIVFALLIIALIRFRRADLGAEPPKQVHGNPMLELVWTLVPAVLLIIIAVPTWGHIFTFDAKIPQEDAFRVRAIGKQWWWEFEYVDSGAVTANELHVPVGRDVVIETYSTDVIHSFWVPRLAGKIDTLPGKSNVLWFNADETGTFYGQCAEYCGTSHANMRFRVVVAEQPAVDDFLARNAQPPNPETDDARAGQALFAAKGCVACHTINGVPGAVGKLGPNLNNLPERTTLASALIDNTPDNLAHWIRAPREVKPGVLMILPLPVSDVESRQLAAYLMSPPGEGEGAMAQAEPATTTGGATTAMSDGAPSAERGKTVYTQTCFACHGPDPSKDGPIGPAIHGASEALVRARVMHGSLRFDQSYPPGYKPKRDTRMMTPFPQLEGDIDDLAAYLNQ